MVPWLVLTGWSTVRYSTTFGLAFLSIGVNLLAGGAQEALIASGVVPVALRVVPFAVVWLCQLAPALAAPMWLSGILHGLVNHPVRLQAAAVGAILAFSFFVMVQVIALFIAAESPVMQVLLRAVLFTMLLEVVQSIIRVFAQGSFSRHMPHDRVIAFLAPVSIVSGLAGRFLVTNMDTTTESAIAAAFLSGIEIALRLTQPARDKVLLRCCRTVCPRHCPAWCCGCCHAHCAECCREPRRQFSNRSAAVGAFVKVGMQHGRRGAARRDSPIKSTSSSPRGSSSSPRGSPGRLALGVAPKSLTRSASPDVVPMEASYRNLFNASGPRLRNRMGEAVRGLLSGAKVRAQRHGQYIHAYYTLLTLSTMAEDVGILLSLPYGLLFRFPARVGGKPIPPLDLLWRVMLQYVMELATALGPALMLWAVNAAFGMRWAPVRDDDVRRSTQHAMMWAAQRRASMRLSLAGSKGESILPSTAGPPAGTVSPTSINVKPASSLLTGTPASLSPMADEGDSDMASGRSATPEAEKRPATSWCGWLLSSCTCRLRHDDPDVEVYRHKLLRNMALEVDRISKDALWAPITTTELLAIGRRQRGQVQVPLTRSGSRRASALFDDAEEDAIADIPDSDEFSWGRCCWCCCGARGLESVEEPGSPQSPSRVRPASTILFQPVTEQDTLSSMQFFLGALSVQCEVMAVRMWAAWQVRFPHWTSLIFLSSIAAVTLAGGSITGPPAMCMLRDAEGLEYFHFCPGGTGGDASG